METKQKRTKVKVSVLALAVLVLWTLSGCAWTEDSMISHWRFNEGSGTTAYDSYGANDGTILGGAIWVDGISGKALGFEAENWQGDDWVYCGDSSDLNVGDGPYTLSAWVKTRKSGESLNYSTIVAKMDSDISRGYEMVMGRKTGTVWAVLASGWDPDDPDNPDLDKVNAIRVWGNTVITDGKWHHIAVTYDGSQSASGMNIYIDGVSDPVTIEFDLLNDTTVCDAGFTIGSRPNTRIPFDGFIDEVAIYNRALTSSEIWDSYVIETRKKEK